MLGGAHLELARRLCASLRRCERVVERCVVDVLGCRREVRVGRFRADAECGGVYVEVEPLRRMYCAVGQAVLWRALAGVDALVVLFGEDGEGLVGEVAEALGLPMLLVDTLGKKLVYYSGERGSGGVHICEWGSGQDHHGYPPRV